MMRRRLLLNNKWRRHREERLKHRLYIANSPGRVDRILDALTLFTSTGNHVPCVGIDGDETKDKPELDHGMRVN